MLWKWVFSMVEKDASCEKKKFWSSDCEKHLISLYNVRWITLCQKAATRVISNRTSDRTKICISFEQHLSAFKNLFLNDLRKKKNPLRACNNYDINQILSINYINHILIAILCKWAEHWTNCFENVRSLWLQKDLLH